MTNPLVAPVADTAPSPWAGVWIAEDVELIASGVRSGSWIDGTLGVVGGALDGLALASDPVGALLQYGIAWLIEHVKPLSEALDWLAGDPAQIAAHAQTWRNVASSLAGEADELARSVRSGLTEWSGAAADAYRTWAGRREQSLRTLATAAETMGLMTEGAGALIGTVRLMVRDAVATVVSRLIVYAAELVATAGLATPLVVEQVGTLCAAWAAKIARWLRELLASLRRLLSESGRLGKLIETLKRWFSEATNGGGGPESPKKLDEETRRRQELGADPAVKRHRAAEVETALRVEEQLGIELRRATDGDIDWVGSDGKTYDSVGNFDGRFFDRQWPNLQTRILDHVEKADRVPVDVARFTDEQKQTVREFIEAHRLEPRVFIVGE
ncbi:WXG100 family type VII secretion target [Actinoplanes bogorensis]|uniref:WXG100 family type VII secretion target n=1 Tax=Paractinoplanes bogorensis TaxID=1610840 RepID=A0ABS5Z488_9ACTN|nr:WXG100 family type VII secretion target [Actinoplanes bogorensis]MBU2670512.1 WXG100 family type VII secretion target [Actinoplanes bogorensis]